MNAQAVIKALEKQYPSKSIFKNNQTNPTEIICEIEPTTDHPDYSIAIAVIDQSIPHHHRHTQEIYEVIKGQLTLFYKVDLKSPYQSIVLKKGDKHTIKPGTYHYAQGSETWIKTTAHPGWTPEDHLII